MKRPVSKFPYLDNVGGAIHQAQLHEYILALVQDGTPLPSEIADLFNVKVIEVEDGFRGIVDWA